MRKFVFLFIICFINIIHIYANVIFRADAPRTVINGQQFQISFTVNDADARNFRGPSSFGDFEVKFGPTSSTSMSKLIVNNVMTSESSITQTYTLLAKKEGTFTIPSANISVNGKTYTSNQLTIKVLPPDKNAPPQNNISGNNIIRGESLGNSASTSPDISPKDLYIQVIIPKQDVYEQECLVATVKLFSRYQHTDIDESRSKIPDFEGFLVEDIAVPQHKPWIIENINGLNYRTVILRQFLLYPQHSGTITIGPAKVDAIVRIPHSNFTNTQGIRKTLTSAPITINVKPLPGGKPDTFSGGVGNIKMTSSLSSNLPKVNEAVTFKVSFEGTGNLKLLKNPEVKFPADFEPYDPKVENDFQATTSGFSGTKSIEYLVIPRHVGNYVIPPVIFSYFDLNSKTYKTIQTPEYKIQVEKGTTTSSGTVSNYTDQEDIKLLGEDIRYIKTGNLYLKPEGEFLFGNLSYYLWHIIPTLLFGILFILFRKQAKENANMALVRNRKANKMANKHLKKAVIYLREQKKEDFYNETIKALWGYLSNKLNIPLSQLSKDNVETKLSHYGVDNSLTKDFLEIIHNCEFAQYAPTGDDDSMEKIYSKTVSAINKMENTIKRKTIIK